MIVKVLRNLGKGLPAYTEGQTVEVDRLTGDDLCKRGLAIDVTPRPKVKAALPPEPEIEPPTEEIHAVPQPPADLSPSPSALPEIGKSSVTKSKAAKADK